EGRRRARVCPALRPSWSPLGYGHGQKRNASVGLDEMTAAVLLPAGFTVLLAERLLLAEADSGHAVGWNAKRNEILLNGGGPAVAEAQVVFSGSAFVAVAFDGHF